MLDLLEEEQRNRSFTLNQANQLYDNTFIISPSTAIYFPYNLDVKDVGWGCAWRAIQTLLSTNNKYLPFPQLYSTFASKQLLLKIVLAHTKVDEQTHKQLQEKKWAPEEIQKHWAQPFIASLISWHLQLPNSLLLLNGYPQAYAPKSVFQKTIKFAQFVTLIKEHIKRSTFMIDDGSYALSIIGYREPSQHFIEFLFADPHIRNNRTEKDVGLYRKAFNMEGKAQEDQRSEAQLKEGLYNVYSLLEFENKNWMICYLEC